MRTIQLPEEVTVERRWGRHTEASGEGRGGELAPLSQSLDGLGLQVSCEKRTEHVLLCVFLLTLEEQQLRELQRHGYENPTYRFLEERP